MRGIGLPARKKFNLEAADRIGMAFLAILLGNVLIWWWRFW